MTLKDLRPTRWLLPETTDSGEEIQLIELEMDPKVGYRYLLQVGYYEGRNYIGIDGETKLCKYDKYQNDLEFRLSILHHSAEKALKSYEKWKFFDAGTEYESWIYSADFPPKG